MKRLGVIGMLLFVFAFANAPVYTLRLQTIDNHSYDLSGQLKRKATAFVFLLADCPACQSYSLTLNQLEKKFHKDSVDFIGIFPGKYGTEKEMLAFRKDYKISFPLLKDPEMKLAKTLGATVAPEVFLMDKSGKTLYSGRIDDWMYALGKKRPVVRVHDLSDAIDAFLQKREIKISKTTPIGCILQYE